jgi:hypothetical protein
VRGFLVRRAGRRLRLVRRSSSAQCRNPPHETLVSPGRVSGRKEVESLALIDELLAGGACQLRAHPPGDWSGLVQFSWSLDLMDQSC